MDSEHLGKRKQNAFWHFKIFGTLVITFFYSALKRINRHNIREKQAAQRTDCRGKCRKSTCIFFCCPKICPFPLTWANNLQQQRNTSFKNHLKIKQESLQCIIL
jgi:hypothetical protein